MSERTSDTPLPPELGAIAALIEESSLGSPAACAARDEIGPDGVMSLRDQALPDSPPLDWWRLASSPTMLRYLGEVVPDVAGRHSGLSLLVGVTGPVLAISTSGDVETFGAERVILPAKAERTVWCLYEAAVGRHRYLFNVVIDDTGNRVGCNYTWSLQVAMAWYVWDPCQLARKRVARIDHDLMPFVRWHLAKHVCNVEGPMPLWQRVRMERELEATFDSWGLAAEIAIQPRFSRRIKPTVTGAMYVVDLMQRYHGSQSMPTYGRHVNELLQQDANTEQDQFCRYWFPLLVNALHVVHIDEEVGVIVALGAFRSMIRVWNSVGIDDRLPFLAGVAMQQVSRLVPDRRPWAH